MRYLLDTHIFIWWLDGDLKLKKSVRDIIGDPGNHIYISVLSGWEMSAKSRSRKLRLKYRLEKCFSVSGFEVLSLVLKHIISYNKLPFYHKDPIDRLLISQAQVEEITLITADQKIWKYKVKVLKC